ncbi:MAG TPA: acyl-CoA dehydrogenase family protein, partial [Actinomycetes bacterium]|nr:acyl-CoA dehydrogenase family protein [Actinomycetes bacterium]
MDFEPSDKCRELSERLEAFMAEAVIPAEPVYAEQMAASGDGHHHPQVMEDLKAEARARGLWNLFLPHATAWTEGLSNLDYAPLAEITGRSGLAPEALNCAAPDTGNMEVLTMFGTDAQKEQWLRPLLEGEIRSCFAMTEPDVASSDATNIGLRIETDGDDYVLNGRKWWISGAARERCKIAIVMGKTDPDAPRHLQQSQVLVPMDTPGLTVVRDLTVFGYTDQEGHCELSFEDVRVPRTNLIGEQGGGFAIAQARLGPGRIHHCMRAIGVAERALEAMCRRVTSRTAFGKPLSEQGVIQEWIADSRMDIEQARLLVLKTAWLMDTVGNKGAR